MRLQLLYQLFEPMPPPSSEPLFVLIGHLPFLLFAEPDPVSNTSEWRAHAKRVPAPLKDPQGLLNK